jgi:anti-anti-sigma regulatory factor
MTDTTRDTLRISLEGDWSMAGVALQYPPMLEQVARLQAAQDKPACCELDLAGISDLDACGCQLLASFARSLRAADTRVSCDGLSEAFKRKIRLLGFDVDLGLRPGLPGEDL